MMFININYKLLKMYNTLAIDDIQQNLAINAIDDQTLLNLCSTSSKMKKICHTKSFWEKRYAAFNIPMLDYQPTLQDNILLFNHAYNSMLMAIYYMSMDDIIYKIDRSLKSFENL